MACNLLIKKPRTFAMKKSGVGESGVSLWILLHTTKRYMTIIIRYVRTANDRVRVYKES